MNNHYKSQLIIKRFSEKVWVYDLNKKTLVQKQPKKILYEEDIYTPEVEEKLHRLETSYSNLIDKKVLTSEEIQLTRKELYLIKKFLVIDSLRQMFGDGIFSGFFKNFEKSALNYFSALKANATFNPNSKVYLEILNSKEHKYLSEIQMPEKDLFMMVLECILDNDLYELHYTNCPLDIIAWSAAITESYLTFWDSSDTEEFLLSDVNMLSEYDMCHMVFGGLNSEKYTYLYQNLKGKAGYVYADFLKTHCVMYENYNVFNLSNNRSIVCVNPFFKLYSDTFSKRFEIEKPDVWVGTTVHHLNAYKIPQNIYKISDRFFTDDDIFIYKPYKLTIEETLAFNLQILNETKNIVGFVNKDKVKKTFAYANVAFSMYDATNAAHKSDDPLAGLSAMVESLMNNKYYPLIKEPYGENKENDFNPFEVFDKNTYLSGIGMKTNYRLYDYFVEQLKTKADLNLEPFDFLLKNGVEDLVEYFTKEAKEAREHNKQVMEDLYNNKL